MSRRGNPFQLLKRFRFHSLTGKMLGMIVLLMTICAVSFTLVAYYEVQRSMTSQMKSDGTTLVTNIKREIISNKLLDKKELQKVFQTIMEEGDGNLIYVSLYDAQGNLIVSDNSQIAGGSAGENDAVASASLTKSSMDLTTVVAKQETTGQILKTPSGEKVYNISTDFTYNQELSGALNLGISLKSMNEQIRDALIETIGISLIILLLAVGLGIWMGRRMILPIQKMSECIKRYAAGDFTEEFHHHSQDEIGKMAQDLAHMRSKLGGMMENIQQRASQVTFGSQQLSVMIGESSQAAKEISTATEALATGSSDLAVHAQEGFERLNSLAEEILALTARADQMKARIEETQEANQTTMNSMKQLQKAIRDNAEVTVNIEEQVNDLSDKSQSITQVTTVIKAVAEQTHLLALNAMIESARAGEQGRGFAVVAEQIRKLAVQTTGSVQGIEEMVREVAAAVEKTREYMHQGTEVITRTSEVSRETGQAFRHIYQTIRQMIAGMQEMIEGITQVNSDKNEVIGTIENISSIAQESTASTEEISASTEQQLASMEQVSASAVEMKEIADDLHRMVGQFKF
ncbi:methyl-accepting chemotaxis protein [Paenibacillus sp. p3-SID1389]|uniref:methyl-accepting chemotaxis protein n=1 Tax=Paenibacillus sp. p3-SID1389 TaxID=2916364 RepID=UPI0021A87622|nr:methyl-accepting chemotaxis protein [Paenibacillus sp. p3-SID1389]MCT2193603.1 methyl-accepting chemotaxis protein [Paenibacillus sp. p3-SID1389]